MRRLLRRSRLKQQRRCQRQAAEAGIGKIGPAIDLDPEQHMRACGNSVGRLAPENARGKPADCKAHRFQRMHEQQIVLETVAAPAVRHHLVLQRCEVEPYRRAQQRVDIVERNRLRMLPVQRRERVERRIERTAIADPGEIGIEVDFGANLETNIKALKLNGTIASYASMGNPEPKIPFYTMMRRGIAVDLVFVYMMKPEERARALKDLEVLLKENRLKHVIGKRFPLSELAAAHEAQESGTIVGNIVIDI